jgi:hypothetical protein
MVWDNQYGGVGLNCSGFSNNNPFICGDTTYTVPSQFVGGHWYDLGPVMTDPTGKTVAIGVNPILLVAP